MDENFLLTTPAAQKLFRRAATLPIIDFHNHLSPAMLAENRNFSNLDELWVAADPYKHRAMRILGIDENLITGKDTAPFTRFKAWAEALPLLVGNPLYHWSMLELERVFDWHEPLTGKNAPALWEHANRLLTQDGFKPLALLKKFNVETACPCLGIADNARTFAAGQNAATKLVPSLRGDDFLRPAEKVLQTLAQLTAEPTATWDGFCAALARRIKEFHAAGCRFADHAIDAGFRYFADDGRESERFARWVKGELTDAAELNALGSAVLRRAAKVYAECGWVLQLHIGAERFTSSRLRAVAGPAGGFAAIASPCDAQGITRFLDDLEREHRLPQTVLFTLNPADNAVLAVLTGSFAETGVPGKIQFGPAWWYNDHLLGMREHLENLGAFGVLSTFVGMTTDSRSVLSFVRHEYFRRAVCGYFGEKVRTGEFPADEEILAELIEKICYRNVKTIFTRSEA